MAVGGRGRGRVAACPDAEASSPARARLPCPPVDSIRSSVGGRGCPVLPIPPDKNARVASVRFDPIVRCDFHSLGASSNLRRGFAAVRNADVARAYEYDDSAGGASHVLVASTAATFLKSSDGLYFHCWAAFIP